MRGTFADVAIGNNVFVGADAYAGIEGVQVVD